MHCNTPVALELLPPNTSHQYLSRSPQCNTPVALELLPPNTSQAQTLEEATHHRTLQHTATHCNPLQHTPPQHTATHCNTLLRQSLEVEDEWEKGVVKQEWFMLQIRDGWRGGHL